MPAGSTSGATASRAGTGKSRQKAISTPKASALRALRICCERSPTRIPRQRSRPNRSTRATPAGTRRPAMAGTRASRYSVKTIAPRDGRGAGGDPVVPADHESRVLAETSAHEHVLATRFGHHRARFGHGYRPEQRVETADDPHAEEERRARQPLGHVARRAEDADQDGVADDHGDTEGDAQHLEQLAPAGGSDQGGRYDSVIHCVRHRHVGDRPWASDWYVGATEFNLL